MARANKYASLNFNDIYEKKASSSKPSSSPSPHPLSSTSAHLQKPQFAAVTRSNGRMLVLTRPTPKPQEPSFHPQPSPPPSQPTPQSPPELPDSISLRPLGRTGSGPSLSPPPTLSQQPSPSQKPDRFVPPHLRPGFVARKESPGPPSLQSEVQKQQLGFRFREFGHRSGQFFSQDRRGGEEGRPKSSGYERIRRCGDAEMMENRPSSGGNRPSSSGW